MFIVSALCLLHHVSFPARYTQLCPLEVGCDSEAAMNFMLPVCVDTL